MIARPRKRRSAPYGPQPGHEKKPSDVATDAIPWEFFPILINHLNAFLLRMES
jgi:hypothetical protein